MLALRIEGCFHWGFWVRYPETSKLQSSLIIPPPTTLIGALIYPLITLNKVKNYYGEMLENEVASPVKLFETFFYGASMYYKESGKGFYIEDINKYVTLHYHRKDIEGKIEELVSELEKDFPNKVTVDEKNRIVIIDNKVKIYPYGISWKIEGEEALKNRVIPLIKDEYFVQRRFLKYRTGAIICGKVYYPGDFVVCYLIDEKKFENLLGPSWANILIYSALNITRIGSKESIVSINNASINEVEKIDNKRIKTFFYFPFDCVKRVEIGEEYYIETFWHGGWGENYPSKPIDYLIPGNKNPIYSKPILLELKEDVKAFRISKKEDEIIPLRV